MTYQVISKKEALEKGLKRYFTGLPCKKGHIAERSTKNATCFVCSSVSKKESYKKNPEKSINRRMCYYNKNKEAEKLTMKESYKKRIFKNPDLNKDFYKKNMDAIKARSRLWAKNNKDKRLAMSRKRKAEKRERTPSWYGEFDDFVMAEASRLAILREIATGIKWHIDHMIPLNGKIASGLHCWNNIQVIPAILNIKKQNKMIFVDVGDWVEYA